MKCYVAPEMHELESFRFLSETIYKNLCELCVSNETSVAGRMGGEKF
jgi:hypothetical protein